ncbi:uncharacterized protein LOC133641650 isoform X2 [Entelurus aequoreus]|uniref:uncharacterized protein LOC133641650 isoform X2 n=1 Tax=Entelurus aequoreus TaxID=161455 RepID=UPI002B1D3AC1|nr:uncharacterized protein LOC133641650 isoform X2 [Entelurus aequoreus]
MSAQRELGVNDVQGLTKQGCSNNCGVFVLMENMLQIRRWWCLALLQNFPMPSEEDRLQDRKRRRVQGGLQCASCYAHSSVQPLQMFGKGPNGGHYLSLLTYRGPCCAPRPRLMPRHAPNMTLRQIFRMLKLLKQVRKREAASAAVRKQGCAPAAPRRRGNASPAVSGTSAMSNVPADPPALVGHT